MLTSKKTKVKEINKMHLKYCEKQSLTIIHESQLCATQIDAKIEENNNNNNDYNLRASNMK